MITTTDDIWRNYSIFAPKGANMEKENQSWQVQQLDTLYSDVRQIIETSRNNAVRSVDFCRVQMYWHLGQRIFEGRAAGERTC